MGANEHGFELNSVVSESECAAFEREHSILLPADYRQFITRIGNGGAGPFYGIFPLGTVDDNFDLRRWQENDHFVGTLSKPFPFRDGWNDLSGMPEDDLLRRNLDEYNRQNERFTEQYWFPINGAIPICHQGCALRIWLVVTGEQAGDLWDDRRSEYQGLRPVSLVNGSAPTFYNWYAEWLDECFAIVGQPNWR